ncbi:MAG: hypothetical protein AAF430_19155 [Myxococcota bacterium]
MPALHALHSGPGRLRSLVRLCAAVLLWPCLASGNSIPHEAAEQLTALGDPSAAAVSAPGPAPDAAGVPPAEPEPAPIVLDNASETFTPVGWSIAPGLPSVDARPRTHADEAVRYRTPAELTLPEE